MRAKNEFKFIAEAYDTKLLIEKAVDGTLMCSKDCCGSPVMECKCGDDCKHCNCFMIQKAVKEYGLKSPLLEAAGDDYDAELPAGHYDTHVRLQRGGRWNAHTVNVRKTDKKLIQKFLDQGFRIVKPFEEDDEYFPFSEHSKNVKMVLKAIDDFKEMVADELKVDGHPEDVNVNELHDAHKHLINAFSVMFDADDVKYITGSENL